MHFELGLKKRDKKNNPTLFEEKKILYYEKNIGYDSAFSKKLLLDNPKDIFYECNSYYLFDKNDPKMYVKDIIRLSPQEKGLFKKFFEFVKDINNKENDFQKYFDSFLLSKKIKLDRDQYKYIFKLIDYEINGFGPLMPLIEDKELIEEIAVIGLGVDLPVYVYVANVGWTKTNIYFTDEEYVKELINKMARSIGRQISINYPILNASLPDGSRLNAIISPISDKYPLITLRKFKANPLTPINLINYNTISEDIATFLWLSMLTDSNILIAGNTGSGKTTTLNAILSFVPKSERIVLCEETPEVNIPHKHKAKLKVDPKKNIGMTELITSTLRMRPDRLVVGEIRTKEEVCAFIDTVLAGQGKGSYATFHALSVNDAIERLLKLGMLEQDLNALDLIIIQRRWNIIDFETKKQKEIRKIVEIAELIDKKPKTIYKYNYDKKVWDKINESKRIKNKIEIVFNREFNIVFNKYKSNLEKIKYKKQNIEDFFISVNNLWDIK